MARRIVVITRLLHTTTSEYREPCYSRFRLSLLLSNVAVVICSLRIICQSLQTCSRILWVQVRNVESEIASSTDESRSSNPSAPNIKGCDCLYTTVLLRQNLLGGRGRSECRSREDAEKKQSLAAKSEGQGQ
jgi:hypothetical protein